MLCFHMGGKGSSVVGSEVALIASKPFLFDVAGEVTLEIG